MRQKPTVVAVYREGSWWRISSVDLLPHDIFSFSNSKILPTLPVYRNCTLPKKSKEQDSHIVMPCDAVLLSGNAIVNQAILTGESLPQMKSKLIVDSSNEYQIYDSDGEHKTSALFGGTTVVMFTPGEDSESQKIGNCIMYATQTGFSSVEGKLIRSVLISKASNNEQRDQEAIYFLLSLAAVALIASAFTVYKTWNLPNRNQYKLLLHCVMIVTSVVPPEFVTTMSMTVGSAITALSKQNIFCTVPSCLMYAGKVTTSLFDKTGTLTNPDILFKGLYEYNQDKKQFTHVTDGSKVKNLCSVESIKCLSTCHSLVQVKSEVKLAEHLNKTTSGEVIDDGYRIVGNTLEEQNLVITGLTVDKTDPNLVKGNVKDSYKQFKLVSRFQFSSAMQRMTVIVNEVGTKNYYVYMKGAPQKVAEFLSHVPDSYNETVRALALKGMRVLAFASKKLSVSTTDQAVGLQRSDVETGLYLNCLSYYTCALKPHTISVFDTLQNASIQVKIVTGDDPLTAASVAKECNLFKFSDTYQLYLTSDKRVELVNIYQEKKPKIAFPFDEIRKNISEKNIIIDGKSLSQGFELLSSDNVDYLVKQIVVFARVSPTQKEQIATLLNKLGETTLMCGDGTNDVGALKASHIGLSLLNTALPEEDKINEAVSTIEDLVVEPVEVSRPRRLKLGLNSTQIENLEKLERQFESMKTRFPNWQSGFQRTILLSFYKLIKASEDKMLANPIRQNTSLMSLIRGLEAELEDNDYHIGNASIAAPFTYSGTSIGCTEKLIRNGKATLARLMMSYKLMALNSLTNAFSLSVMTLNGVKFGERQMTIEGIEFMILYVILTFAKPAQHLTKDRVVDSLFDCSLLLSIIVQSLVHIVSYSLASALATRYSRVNVLLDGPFKPNLLNTLVVIISSSQLISTIIANYEAGPFLQPWKSFSTLKIVLFIYITVLFGVALQGFPSLNLFLQLVKIPNKQCKVGLLLTLAFDMIGASVAGRYFMRLGRYNKLKRLNIQQ